MRIISGSAKGRRLFAPPATHPIRPTSDRAREALFSIIGTAVIDGNVLDLFAGTGALGCEALSRGAAGVVFIDNSRKALDLVAQNILLVDNGRKRSTLLLRDLGKGLKLAGDLLPPNGFDLVFADPPYDKGLAEMVLRSLDNCAILSPAALLIVEEHKRFLPPPDLQRLTMIDQRRYGDSLFTFFRPKPGT